MMEKNIHLPLVSILIAVIAIFVAPILIVYAQQDRVSIIKSQFSESDYSNPAYYQDNGSDICVTPENIPDEELHWTYIPQAPAELNTRIKYHYLAGVLISKGVVDASECPYGGLNEFDLPNACGLAVAEDMVYQMQNQFDDEILAAWDDVGVPPVLLKQLIRQESQFWPGRWGLYHWGLGHVTYSGAHTGLLWNFKLFREVCIYTYDGQCHGIDSMLIYALLGLFNAECEECENKLEVEKAERSVHYLAETVLGHCNQTSQIIYNVTGRPADEVVDYVTVWKLTLYDYNAGASCVYDTLEQAYQNVPLEERTTVTFDWDTLENYTVNTHCNRGIMYADEITKKIYDFPPDIGDD